MALSGFERASCSRVATAPCAGHVFQVDEVVRFSRAAKRAKGVNVEERSCVWLVGASPGASAI